ncbi:MAG: lipid-A-disaccharide synthase [Prevotellaceae bacterium]|jgi:lipid-A-disaccharide synthase|nr:lipid-A-disaccharide synthase [Prevotellaceae bacterium]
MKIYFVTGEPSGDILASSLIKALIKKAPDAEFFGVGGETMKSCGFNSLFDMSELSVMGFFEVLPRLPLILKRLKQTVADIERVSPDVIITVDSWGFVSELLSRLRKKNVRIPKIHYVAPQVWAWKKGRAKKVARLTDCLMTLLPNEPQYFEKYGLKSCFVGHPVVETDMDSIDTDGFRKRHGIPETAEIYTVLPGSRNSEVKRLVPVFKKAAQIIAEKTENPFFVVPTVETVAKTVEKIFKSEKIPCCTVTGRSERYATFKLSKAAIAASGTVSLELVRCKTPHIVAYRFSSITNFLADILIKVKYANLINILCSSEIIPEFMLKRCRPDLIASKILYFRDKTVADSQIKQSEEGLQKLYPSAGILPSERAAEIVIEIFLEKKKTDR